MRRSAVGKRLKVFQGIVCEVSRSELRIVADRRGENL